MTVERKLTIFLLRHGEPEFPDLRSYIYGHTDYSLSARGIEQANRSGAALADIKFDRIISSDLRRARQTAEIVNSHLVEPLNIVCDSAFREINMGDWDGLPKEAIMEGFAELFEKRGQDLVNTAPPNGESFADLQKRAVAAFDRVVTDASGGGNILIVAHGGFFWTIVAGVLKMPLDMMFSFGLDFCALHMLEYKGDNCRLIRYNWSPDLTDYSEKIV